MTHPRSTYWPKLEPSKPSSKMSAMLRHLNQHCETKLQWLVLLTQPLPGYQHTADRRACHRPTKGTPIPTPILITRLNQTTRSVEVVAATSMAPWGPGLACSNCGKPNHPSRVCQAKKVAQVVRKGPEANEAAMDTLITHITFNQMTGTYTAKDTR